MHLASKLNSKDITTLLQLFRETNSNKITKKKNDLEKIIKEFRKSEIAARERLKNNYTPIYYKPNINMTIPYWNVKKVKKQLYKLVNEDKIAKVEFFSNSEREPKRKSIMYGFVFPEREISRYDTTENVISEDTYINSYFIGKTIVIFTKNLIIDSQEDSIFTSNMKFFEYSNIKLSNKDLLYNRANHIHCNYDGSLCLGAHQTNIFNSLERSDLCIAYELLKELTSIVTGDGFISLFNEKDCEERYGQYGANQMKSCIKCSQEVINTTNYTCPLCNNVYCHSCYTKGTICSNCRRHIKISAYSKLININICKVCEEEIANANKQICKKCYEKLEKAIKGDN